MCIYILLFNVCLRNYNSVYIYNYNNMCIYNTNNIHIYIYTNVKKNTSKKTLFSYLVAVPKVSKDAIQRLVLLGSPCTLLSLWVRTMPEPINRQRVRGLRARATPKVGVCLLDLSGKN